MLNGAHATIRGICMVDLNLTLAKTMQIKNMYHIPSIRKNLVSYLSCIKMAIKLCLILINLC
uniref:Uncharacterized protein n=1 Tax=Zea mays TaxID=4577 RepID=B6UDL2_MAIZE|nr:hypothetical protein [Zea mays]